MKTQFLSNLTNKEVWTLFFLTLLYLKGVEAGQAFRNCLKYELNDTITYDNLLKFPFPSGVLSPGGDGVFYLDCNTTGCYKNVPGGTPYYRFDYFFTCMRANQYIFCGTWVGGSRQCGGIVGDDQITITSWQGRCSSIQSNETTPISLLTIRSSLVGLNQGYAVCGSHNSTGYSPCLSIWNSCNWDNNFWGCFTGFCYAQFPTFWPGAADKNPLLTQTTLNPTSTQTLIPTPISIPQNEYLVEKIAIPVGIVTGACLVSGLIIYYYCQKKKKRVISTDNHFQLEVQSSPARNDLLPLPFVQKIELEGANKLITSTPPLSPVPSSISNSRTQLLNQLRTKLLGHEQLWSDYLDANNLLLTHPQSQVAMREFSRLQNQLLQILTIGEIELLKQTPLQTTPRFSNQQTANEYFGVTENYSEETRNPQTINTLTENNCRRPQGQYFEVREPQGILNYHY